MKKIKFDQLIFYLAIFFMPSAFFISAIFLFINLVISLFKYGNEFFNDKWNYPFFISSILMVFSCLINSKKDLDFVLGLDEYLSWLGLFNWIPMFLLFWGMKPYLRTYKQRYITSLFLISGTFIVLATGFGQYWFNWVGPADQEEPLYNVLGGLIIWSQRPLDSGAGMTGLFNNANYTASWLNIIAPFCIALLINNQKNLKNKFFALIISIGVFISLFLTKSRK